MTRAAGRGNEIVEPGLYRHYKGNLYRVLFVVPWWGSRRPVSADAVIHVKSFDDLPGAVDHADAMAFMTALWSGNGSTRLEVDEPIVVYIALYGEGRIAARVGWEFTQDVEVSSPAGPVRKPRFERVGA